MSFLPLIYEYAVGCSLEVFGYPVFAVSVSGGGGSSCSSLSEGGETCCADISTWGGGSRSLYGGGEIGSRGLSKGLEEALVEVGVAGDGLHLRCSADLGRGELAVRVRVRHGGRRGQRPSKPTKYSGP